jgi:ribosomal protein L37AE/L43A
MRRCPECGGTKRRRIGAVLYECRTPLRIASSPPSAHPELLCGAKYADRQLLLIDPLQ